MPFLTSMLLRSFAALLLLCVVTVPRLVAGLAFTPRRAFLVSTAAALMSTNPEMAKAARLMLNEDGEYEEISEADWQTAWKERLEKAQGMTPEEVFMAARGAGNTNLKDGPESDASKKRRAMAGCRDTGIRTKAGIKDPKDCTARVLGGETDFILDAM